MTRRSLLLMLGGSVAVRTRAATTPEEEALRRKDKMILHSPRPLDMEAPPELLDTWITPASRFFVRNHFYIPRVTEAGWQVSIEGLVQKPHSVTLEEIRRMPQIERVITLECAGNGRAFFEPHVAGIQWRKGAVGTARWKGVRLRDVLARAALKPEAKHVAFDGADTGTGAAPDFIRSIPVEKCLHPDTLLATHMNGAPIPIEHGFPLRLITPGWEGAACVKWVTKMTALPDEAEGFFMRTAYRYPTRSVAPGEAVDPKDMAAITSLSVKSLITRGTSGRMEGVAWAGEADVTRVEVSTDGGRTWNDSKLGADKAPFAWRRFRYDGKPASAAAVLSRATDSRGRVQPATPAWNPLGYLHNTPDSAPHAEPPTLASALPPGAGSEIAAEKCLACHDHNLIVGQHLDPGRWNREVEKMMRWGAPLNDKEKETLTRYLTDNFK